MLARVLNNEVTHKSIATLNRVQLLVDSLQFAWSGELDYQVAFEVLKYLKYENEYLPWRSGLSSLSQIERLLRRTSSYGIFKVNIFILFLFYFLNEDS